MQGFSVESKTSGIIIKHLMTRPWSPVQVKQWSEHDSKKPKDPTWEDGKLWGPSQKSVESCETRSFIQFGEKLTTRAHMQKGEGSRRLGKQHRAKEATNWAEMGPGRSAQPVLRPSWPPFDLGGSRPIYSPLTESHASINSSSAAEEQRSLRGTISEMRVVLVV
jgi:hypothetical protein